MGRLKLFLALRGARARNRGRAADRIGPAQGPGGRNSCDYTDNLTPLGFLAEARRSRWRAFFNSDLAFWGDSAFQGSYDGLRAIDITYPSRPKEIVFQPCNGNQGDVVVWDDVLIRSYNSPAAAGALCDGEPIPVGFEGIHVFDISNLGESRARGDACRSRAARTRPRSSRISRTTA